MIMNIILGATLYPTMFIVYLVVTHTVKKGGTILYGVRMEKEWLESETYLATDRCYRKQMRTLLLLAAILPVFAFFTPYVSIQFTIWMVWFVLFILALQIPYIIAFRKLKSFKQEMRRKEQAQKAMEETDADVSAAATSAGSTVREEAPIFVDLDILEQVRCFRVSSFILPMLLTVLSLLALYLLPALELVPATDSATFLAVYRGLVWTLAVTNLAFIAMAYWVDRGRQEIVSDDSVINANYNRAKKKCWFSIWKEFLWINTLLIVALSIAVTFNFAVNAIALIGSILEALLLIAVIFYNTQTLRRVHNTYLPKTEEKYKKDDEDYWILGAFYYNPADKRNLVEQRFSMGYTMNMAKPAGIILEVIGLLCFLLIPVVCVWMIQDELSPKEIYIENETLICHDQSNYYEIPLSDIQEFRWEKLPDERTKTNGTNYATFEKGEYYEYHAKDFREFAFTDQDQVIFLQTSEWNYYLSCETAEKTQALMDELLQQ